MGAGGDEMGQTVAALAFGGFLPQDVLAWETEDSEEPGLVESFLKGTEAERDRPQVPSIDHDQDLVVFLVAMSGEPDEGVAEMNTGPVADLERDPAYRKPLARARRNWEKFRKHAAKRGVDVGDGKLWLTEVEVA
jgi:hypothetical protein